MPYPRPYNARLTIRKADDGMPSVLLDDKEIAGLLTANGLRITASEYFAGEWNVSMDFGPGALHLDFDVELLDALRAQADAKAASGE